MPTENRGDESAEYRPPGGYEPPGGYSSSGSHEPPGSGDSPDQSGPGQYRPVQYGSGQPEPGQYGQAPYGQPEPTQPGPASYGPTSYGPGQPGQSQYGPGQPEQSQYGPGQSGSPGQSQYGPGLSGQSGPPGQSPYGPGQPGGPYRGQPPGPGHPGKPGGRKISVQVSPGLALIVVGGLLYFVGSFLSFLSFDLRDVCSAVPPEAAGECQQAIPDETLSAGGWNSVFIAVAAVLMLGAALVMAGQALRVIPSSARVGHAVGGAVGLSALLTLIVVGVYDAAGLSVALVLDLVDELQAQLGTAVDDVPLPGLGVGAWLCLVGLLAALTGVILVRVLARRGARIPVPGPQGPIRS